MAPEKKRNVKLRLEMDPADAERLIAAFKAGKLAELGVVNIEFPTRPDVMIQSPEENHAARPRPGTKKPQPPHR
jgi:hypothetical protein